MEIQKKDLLSGHGQFWVNQKENVKMLFFKIKKPAQPVEFQGPLLASCEGVTSNRAGGQAMPRRGCVSGGPLFEGNGGNYQTNELLSTFGRCKKAWPCG